MAFPLQNCELNYTLTIMSKVRGLNRSQKDASTRQGRFSCPDVWTRKPPPFLTHIKILLQGNPLCLVFSGSKRAIPLLFLRQENHPRVSFKIYLDINFFSRFEVVFRMVSVYFHLYPVYPEGFDFPPAAQGKLLGFIGHEYGL